MFEYIAAAAKAQRCQLEIIQLQLVADLLHF